MNNAANKTHATASNVTFEIGAEIPSDLDLGFTAYKLINPSSDRIAVEMASGEVRTGLVTYRTVLLVSDDGRATVSRSGDYIIEAELR